MLDINQKLLIRPALKPISIFEQFSLEVPIANVAMFNPNPTVFPHKSLVFLPHMGGQNARDMGTACRTLVERSYVPVPHIGARHLSSEHEYRDYLQAAAENGANHVLLLAGDKDKATGPFSSALDLINSPELERSNIKNVMISGYPEGHPQISAEIIATAMQEKLTVLSESGCKITIVSQFAFDSAAYIDWVKQLRENGISHDIRIGIAGVTSLVTLIKFAKMCGVGASLSMLRKRSSAVLGMLGGYNPKPMIDNLAEEFQSNGLKDVYVHFFPFGGDRKTLDWLADLDKTS